MTTTHELFTLDGSFSVVTGGSGWLGAAMVEALARAGSRVLAVARDEDRLERVARPLREEGLGVATLGADVTAPDWPVTLASALEGEARVDVLVNNAHVGRGGSMRTASRSRFDEAFHLAVTAAWEAIEVCRPGLAASARAGRSASVVNISSMYGLVAPDLGVYDAEDGRNPPYYGAAKAGLLQLSRYAAEELGSEGIRVNAIAPGPFPATGAQQDPQFVAALARRTMVGRVGRPDDLRTALLFLASPHSRFVTGATIAVDGGWTAR